MGSLLSRSAAKALPATERENRIKHLPAVTRAAFTRIHTGGDPTGLDPPRISLDDAPSLVLNHSSGLGGGNVGHLLRRPT
jgi:hypothetical protein